MRERKPEPGHHSTFRDAGRALVEPASATDGRRDRAGKSLIAGHFNAAVQRQLKILAATEGRTVQSLLGEALRLLFDQRHVPWPEASPTTEATPRAGRKRSSPGPRRMT